MRLTGLPKPSLASSTHISLSMLFDEQTKTRSLGAAGFPGEESPAAAEGCRTGAPNNAVFSVALLNMQH